MSYDHLLINDGYHYGRALNYREKALLKAIEANNIARLKQLKITVEDIRSLFTLHDNPDDSPETFLQYRFLEILTKCKQEILNYLYKLGPRTTDNKLLFNQKVKLTEIKRLTLIDLATALAYKTHKDGELDQPGGLRDALVTKLKEALSIITPRAMTPLLIPIIYGDLDVYEILIQRTPKFEDYENPFAIAAANGNFTMKIPP